MGAPTEEQGARRRAEADEGGTTEDCRSPSRSAARTEGGAIRERAQKAREQPRLNGGQRATERRKATAHSADSPARSKRGGEPDDTASLLTRMKCSPLIRRGHVA